MEKSQKKNNIIVLTIIVILFVVCFRLLMYFQSHTSALLYVGFPFVVTVAVIVFTGNVDKTNWVNRYWRYTWFSLIVFLASSIALFEGFICFIMFLPIYFTVVLFVFLIEYGYRHITGRNGNTLPMHLFPMLVVVSSLEGVSAGLSFDRYNEVSVSKIIEEDIAQIKHNLAQPIYLGEDKPAFLKLFPMPHQVLSGALTEGDVHRSDFRYHRWFFTNTHEGHISLKLAEIGDDFIRTEIVEDTSYLSNYLTLYGTEIHMEPQVGGGTKVTLSVSYDRKLDPAWYFAPLERYGVKKTASYLIDKVIHRESGIHEEVSNAG